MFKKGKYINVGIGTSKLTDPYDAAVEAATIALAQAGGNNTFSIVYTNSNFDQKLILKGVNQVLGKNWVGSSVDKQFSSNMEFNHQTILSVLVLNSDYIHFGVSVEKNYTRNPFQLGEKSAKNAMNSIKTDKYVDSYVQFTRMKKQDYSNLVRTPPYFFLTLLGSLQKKKGQIESGEEGRFLEGLQSVTGPTVPIFGFGSASDFDKFVDDKIPDSNSHQFANGQLYQNSAIAIFVVSNLFFEIDVQHSFDTSRIYLTITKLHKNKFDILELNGNEPVLEYCKALKIKKQDYLKDYYRYSLNNPLGVIALDGKTYIKEAFPNADGKTLHCTYQLKENLPMNVLQHDSAKIKQTMSQIVKDSMQKHKNAPISISLFANCSSRRMLLNGHEQILNDNLQKTQKKGKFFGAYVFSEIGSTSSTTAQVHGETVTSLIIYDKLLSE